jgi:3-hydroxybutyryl-CoA dehydrogenase
MSIKTIAVIGAGTMGSGIAQVFAQAGFTTILFDTNKDALAKGMDGIKKSLSFLVGKQKISTEDANEVIRQIDCTDDITSCKADLILEAIVENLEIKKQLFLQLAAINDPNTILATNTSSLSVSAIQETIPNPGRVVGIHFFNPAQAMKLIEVVKGKMTTEETVNKTFELCKYIGKVPVICKDAPGFIVNRVARHYYLEAMKLVEEGVADIESIDQVMESAGFKMGPFRLMDLIGMDVNLAVSESIYQAFDQAERFKPSNIQREKVKAGNLGKKTGKGFYDYNQNV